MRTIKQQTRRNERERNRAHDLRIAGQHQPRTVTVDCAWGSHATCRERVGASIERNCTCECHRPKATRRAREEW